MTDNDTALQRLTDESAIRNLVARFGLATTTNDSDMFRTLWAPDSVWSIGDPHPQEARGVDDIVAMLGRFWAGNDYFLQVTTPGAIEIDGDAATSRSLCQEFGMRPGERYYRTSGIWTDRIRRTADGWRFAERSWQYLWVDFSPYGGDIFPVAAGHSGG